MSNKYLDYNGVESLWKRIKAKLDTKLESVTNSDDSIKVTSNREIAVALSESEGNLISVEKGGLYAKAPTLHKLTFGAGEEYIYDGSEDITVPVYDGTHDIKE